MPPFITQPKFKQGMSTVQNLNPTLLLKVDKTQISADLAAAILDNTEGNVASTKTVAELNVKAVLNAQRIATLIDDSATGGTDKAWSVDKLKAYIAQEDDTYFVATLSERDDDSVGIVLPKRQGIRVFVADAGADTDVGVDSNGVPFGANYVHNGSEWVLIRTLEYRQIDVTPFVRYDDVVDNLDSVETSKPLSANQGRLLAMSVAMSASSITMAVDDVDVADGGIIHLSKIAKGQATNGMAFVMTDEGLVPVFVTMAADGKSATIIEDDTTLYNAKAVRISYLTDGTTVEAVPAGDGGDGLVI